MMTRNKRHGIVGGLFDPIHYGHLELGKNACRQLQLDKVMFIPSYHPPHRTEHTGYEKRCRMVELAIGNNPDYILSRIEAEIEGPGFTVEVLKRLHERHPDVKFYFLIGSDNLTKMEDWHKPEEIFDLADVAMAYRPGENMDLTGKFADLIIKIEMPAVNISSTAIRNAVKKGDPIDRAVPKKVADYIYRENLYVG